MQSLTILAPAKVNLILKVLGKRRDGYHELRTLFHRISLCDRLVLKKLDRSKFHLTVKGAKLGPVRENLIHRAFKLLRKIKSFQGGLEVTLEKRIPHTAGLGGGSSDAAHFLLGVNRLFKLKLGRKKLLQLGTQLGSDVPFFLYDVNQAIGRGRGEKIKVFLSKNKFWFTLVVPPFKLSTASVYQAFSRRALTRISRDATITSAFSGRLDNDLFQVSCALRSELKQLDLLFDELGVSRRLMSGSGPTMFSIHKSKREAERIARQLRHRKPKARVIICHTE
ncbi:MAG: 4-(cytidine 5'-diphospho)-2-C-methyl-D-erythritol kinase [Candidatus Omnitrophica bacterium]|nr:4-(cytidine 5'-diphospho)-2-C-methyl-D-erythritol kinase [Candidatus Omnitrophota bacterium]